MKIIENKILVLIFVILLLNTFLSIGFCIGSEKVTISGKIKDKKNGEDIIGVTIFIKELKTGTVANEYGFYSVSIKPGNYTVIYSFVGYSTIEKKLNLTENITLNIELEEKVQTINEVVITGEKQNSNVVNNEMSVVKLDAKTIQKIPALMGEIDIIKAVQLLPGVQAASEGSSGYSVRGGSMSQNLILLDEATVYNASHLFGFFSVFNNDAVKNVKLFKGDIPAEFGGRLSSLLDVRMKDGNMKKFSLNGGIGTISSRLTLECPIIKDKCSFLVSGRRTYADLFLLLSSDKNIKNSQLFFYDLSMKINYIINDKNRFFLSGYMGRDVFKFGKIDANYMNWGNITFTARWNHLFSEKLFSNFTILNSDYDYTLGQESTIAGQKWISSMKDISAKADFGYFLNTDNTIKFGAISTLHQFNPGLVKGTGEQTRNNEIKIPSSNALEHAIFIGNEHKINALLTINYGFRYTVFQNMGKATVYNYDENYNSIDSTVYGANKIFNTYQGLEPRFSFTYLLNETSSVKGSYSKTKQYLLLASNSVAGSPLDVWLPSSPNIKPQNANQASIGYFRNIKKNMFETSIEIYYKKMDNQIDFKDNAEIIQNPKIEGEIRVGDAISYGFEFLLRKQIGKLNGWFSYTYSKTECKVPGINKGKWYPASYDKTHYISIVTNYQLTERLCFSATWVYSTGAPATFPTGRFVYGNAIAPVYSDRNAYRLPDYHRLDLGINYDFKQKPTRKFYSSLNFSIYNAYNQKNAFMITFSQNDNEPTKTQAYKVYLFPIIPSLTYNIHF